MQTRGRTTEELLFSRYSKDRTSGADKQVHRAACAAGPQWPRSASGRTHMRHVRRSRWRPSQLIPAAAVAALMFLMTDLGKHGAGATQQGSTPTAPPSFDPKVVVQAEDYGAVRKKFRTELSRRGPSPQKEPMIDP